MLLGIDDFLAVSGAWQGCRVERPKTSLWNVDLLAVLGAWQRWLVDCPENCLLLSGIDGILAGFGRVGALARRWSQARGVS